MNKINNKLRYFKSALAFFFLFFLHGTSIGNGQQGISYNVKALLLLLKRQNNALIKDKLKQTQNELLIKHLCNNSNNAVL